MRSILALAAIAALSACAPTMVAAPAGAFQSATPLAVDLEHSWTHIPPQLNGVTNGSVLTRHGVMLERVDLMSIRPGGSILKVARNVDAPQFRAGMSEPELVELVTSSLSRLGFTDLNAANIRPHQLVFGNGVRFELTGKYRSGLNMRGDCVLAESNGALNVILFLAPAAYYYDANEAEIDHLIQSARVAS